MKENWFICWLRVWVCGYLRCVTCSRDHPVCIECVFNGILNVSYLWDVF